MKYFLGVDAGNTKTVAVIARADGQIIGFGRSKCGDIYNAGTPQRALLHVHEAICAALKSASLRKSALRSAAFSMAGADWPEDFALIESGLRKRNYAPDVFVVNDAVGALYAGASDDWGVAIAAGTGAAVSARAPNGQIWHSSFWQEMGGALSLGANALRAVYKANLGITAATALTEATLSFYQVTSVEDLLHRFTQREGAHLGNVPLLARTVLDVAASGDAVALSIVQQEGTILAEYALAAARQVNIHEREFPLVLAGSVFKHHSSILPDAISKKLQSMAVVSEVLKNQLEPSVGALIIALELGSTSIGRGVRSKLLETHPPRQFFQT